MSTTAIILITLSAFSHALWNLLSKRSRPSAAFFLTANGAAALILSPLLIVYKEPLLEIPVLVWLLLGATGLFQAIYFIGLAGAYRRGDMSLAYPMARSIPVILVAIVSLLSGKASQISNLSLIGMVTVSFGCLILPLPGFSRLSLRNYASASGSFALIAAFGTAGYTIIDDLALRHLRFLPQIAVNDLAITLLYVVLEAMSLAIISGMIVILRRDERLIMLEIWRNGLSYAALTGCVIVGTYTLVLIAMAHVRDVSYVAAFRPLSIPLGALLGMTLLGEPKHTPKIIGVLAVFVGLLLVSLS